MGVAILAASGDERSLSEILVSLKNQDENVRWSCSKVIASGGRLESHAQWLGGKLQ
jgi:hypothetical protein